MLKSRLKFSDLTFKSDSSGRIMRTRITFGSKYALSVIKESHKPLYEIGALVNDELTELPGITDEDNTVRQGLTPDDIDFIIMKMHTISTEQPMEEDV